MRSILTFAAILFVGGGIVSRYAEQSLMRDPPAQAAVVRSTTHGTSAAAAARSMTLRGDRSGHFRVDARIEGRSIPFVVDSGASLVTLRESDAARIGIRPSRGDYTARVSTANGSIKAARTRLARIEVGNITVSDVAALVLPDEALGQNLLGVSFLSRLKRYEYANGRMMLEQ
jgi:aspartyl protease family protein